MAQEEMRLRVLYSQLRSTGTAGHTNWYSAQELASDEMVVTTKGGDWYDGGWLIDFHKHNYSPYQRSGYKQLELTLLQLLTQVMSCLMEATLDANGTAQIRASKGLLLLETDGLVRQY